MVYMKEEVYSLNKKEEKIEKSAISIIDAK